MSQQEAEAAAVRRFGSAGNFAGGLEPFALPIRMMLGFVSLTTVMVAAWLCFVIVAVLPARDPEHIPMWSGVAAGFLAYSVLCGFYLARGPRGGGLRAVVLAASVVAIALGCYGIVYMVQVARSGGHFEGYVILIGLILLAHGLTALAYTALTAKLARQVRAH